MKSRWLIWVLCVCGGSVGAIPEGKSCPDTKYPSQEILINRIDRGTTGFIATIVAKPLSEGSNRIRPDKALIVLTQSKSQPIDLIIDKGNECQGCQIIPVNLTSDAFTTSGQKVALHPISNDLYYLSSLGYSCDLKTRSAFQYFGINGYIQRIQDRPSEETPSASAVLFTDNLSKPAKKFVVGEIYIPKSFYETVGYNKWIVRECPKLPDGSDDEACKEQIQSLSSSRLGLWLDNNSELISQPLCSAQPCPDNEKFDDFALRFRNYAEQLLDPTGNALGAIVHFQRQLSPKEFAVNFDRIGTSIALEAKLFGLGKKGFVVVDPASDFFAQKLAEKISIDNPTLFTGGIGKYSLFAAMIATNYVPSGMNYSDVLEEVKTVSFTGKSIDEIAEMVRKLIAREKTLSWKEFPDDGDVELFRNTWSRIRMANAVWGKEVEVSISSDDPSITFAVKNALGILSDIELVDGKKVLSEEEKSFSASGGLYITPSVRTGSEISTVKVNINFSENGISKVQSFRIHLSGEKLFARSRIPVNSPILKRVRDDFPGNMKKGENAIFNVNTANTIITSANTTGATPKLVATIGSTKRTVTVSGTSGTGSFSDNLSVSLSKEVGGREKYYINQPIYLDANKTLMILGLGMPQDLVTRKLRKTIERYMRVEFGQGFHPDLLSIPDQFQSSVGLFREMTINSAGSKISGLGLSPFEFTSIISDGDYDSVLYFGHGLDFVGGAGVNAIYGSPSIGKVKGIHGESRGPTLYLGVHDFDGTPYTDYVPPGTIFSEVQPKKKTGVIISLGCLAASNVPKDLEGVGIVWNSTQYFSKNWGWQAIGSENYVSTLEENVNILDGGYKQFSVYGELESPSHLEEFKGWQSNIEYHGGVCTLPSSLTDHKISLKSYKWNGSSFEISSVPTPSPISLSCIPMTSP